MCGWAVFKKGCFFLVVVEIMLTCVWCEVNVLLWGWSWKTSKQAFEDRNFMLQKLKIMKKFDYLVLSHFYVLLN